MGRDALQIAPYPTTATPARASRRASTELIVRGAVDETALDLDAGRMLATAVTMFLGAAAPTP
jgi:hypothetical protein